MKKVQRPALVAIAATYLVFAMVGVSSAQIVVLHNFGSAVGDPSSPSLSGIIAQGRDGNLYSTSPSGGTGTGGTVFKITPSGALNVLYNFDSTHGATPYGGLTLASDGNFYGTTATAGSGCCGVVFKITPAGALTVLHNFSGAADGGVPQAPPIQGTDGNFYGTTTSFGAQHGTVYKMTPAGALTTIFNFDVTHGAQPQAPLIQGKDGNFYGTTPIGGNSASQGTVFKITPSGQLTTIFKFDGIHGSSPIGPLVQGSDGNFYGTTFGAGDFNFGTVFKLTPSGVITTLHSFNFSPDGGRPYAGLVEASNGSFYGATSDGGTLGFGTIFNVTSGGSFTVVYTFDNTTGAYPWVTPMQRTSGVLYGDTTAGGTGSVSPCSVNVCGVFYSLDSGSGPFIRLVTAAGKVGKSIGILGQDFTGTTAVTFNGTLATFQVVSATYLKATVPNGATTGLVRVTAGSTLTSKTAFRVMPQILSFSPPSGPVGTLVTITGVSLTQTTKVTFSGKAAVFTKNSDTQVTGTVPAGAVTGKIAITTSGGTASSATNFTVQ